MLLPPGYSVESAPETLAIEAKSLALRVEHKSSAPADGTTGTQLTFTRKLSIDSRQFDPASYRDLRKVLDANAASKNAEVKVVKKKES